MSTEKPRLSITLGLELSKWLHERAKKEEKPRAQIVLDAVEALRESDPNAIALDLPEDILEKLEAKAKANYRSVVDEAKWAISLYVEKRS